ncbi:MAG: hypothetical protein QM804_17780 [Propionicimonas sp.]
MELVRLALSRIRGDLRRSLATFAAVAVAVTSFVVLAASTATQQATVTETAEENYRAAYDILVRPKDSALEKERVEGLVRSNYLSGTFGGLTLDQLETIKGIPGVEVAAPIAMLGYIYQQNHITVDTSPWLAAQGQTLLRWRTTATARNATAATPGPAGYRYQTDRKLNPQPGWESTKENPKPPPELDWGAWELVDGSKRYPCPVEWGKEYTEEAVTSPSDPRVLWEGGLCRSTVPDPDPELEAGLAEQPQIQLTVVYPMLIAAIDPAAEAALVGLDAAVYQGRYLTAEDAYLPGEQRSPEMSGFPVDAVPVIVAGTQTVDYQLRLTIDRLPESVLARLGGIAADRNRELVLGAPSDAVVNEQVFDAAELYAQQIRELPLDQLRDYDDYGPDDVHLTTTRLWRPTDVTYSPGSLRPLAREPDPQTLRTTFMSESNFEVETVPLTAEDTGYRDLTGYTVYEVTKTHVSGLAIDFNPVGKFDPTAIREFSGLSAVPLETYTSPNLVGADEASAKELGNGPMRSDLNLAGYLQQAPALLMPLNGLGAFRSARLGVTDPDTFEEVEAFDDSAPISAVRVRVAGVTGMDDASRERIAAVATSIAEVVDADVDITIGSSPELLNVELPQTKLGSPALTLAEPWSRKGVAVQIVAAIDAKSLLLFGLILISSALTVAISAGAAVQTRRRELGILAAIGWRPGRRRLSLLVELAILGGAAGIVGALVSWPLALVAQAGFDWPRALLAIPAALLLTVLAGSLAAWRAGRIRPIEALRPAELAGGRRMVQLRGGGSLGLTRILRRPGRLVLGSTAIALAVASMLVLVSLAQVFRGRVVGTLLGDAVAVLVRPQDLVASGFLGLLGLVAIGLILFLNLTEDARMYASLQAVGWRQSWLARSLGVQALAIGTVGSTLGVAGGLAIMVWLTESIPPEVAQIAATVVAVTLLASLIVALIPAAALRRLPTARLLAED